MITVRLFASLRETLNCDSLTLENVDGLTDVNALVGHLAALQGETWGQVLASGKVLVAVNQEVATRETPLQAGDEVAFFPPVTGG